MMVLWQFFNKSIQLYVLNFFIFLIRDFFIINILESNENIFLLKRNILESNENIFYLKRNILESNENIFYLKRNILESNENIFY